MGHTELRTNGVLRSSLPEIATWHTKIRHVADAQIPFSGDTQEEVGSKGPTLWEAGKEPQVMGAKTRRDGPASRTYSS